MLTMKIWTYMYGVTIALTAYESTKRNLIKNVTGEDRAKSCGYICYISEDYLKATVNLDQCPYQMSA